MKIDFETFKSRLMSLDPPQRGAIADVEFGAVDQPMNDSLRRKLWRPVLIGAAVIAVFIVAAFIYAAIAQINGAIVSSGVVRVESNRQTIRHQDGGVVRRILVTEGQRVRAGQPLLQFDDLQSHAAVDVMQNQEDAASAQYARYAAEASGSRTLAFPQDLLSRQSDPNVAAQIQTQTGLFASRLMFVEGQTSILSQRMEQLDTRVDGLKVQIESIDEQVRLTEEELSGYRTLNEKGFAPKNLLLRYERQLADLRGRRGALMSDVTRTEEQKGETRLQLVSVRQQRQTEASEGLREAQTRLSDVSPRLVAAKEVLARTSVRSPVDGYVLNLTQFTVGGVAGAGEVLMDIVPVNVPLIVTVRIRPDDIDSVAIGMPARVTLSAYASRRLPPIEGEVTTISADRIVNERTGDAYFNADIKVDPKELAKLGRDIRMTPGMSVSAMILTGKRSILSYLIDPMTETVTRSMREP